MSSETTNSDVTMSAAPEDNSVVVYVSIGATFVIVAIIALIVNLLCWLRRRAIKRQEGADVEQEEESETPKVIPEYGSKSGSRLMPDRDSADAHLLEAAQGIPRIDTLPTLTTKRVDPFDDNLNIASVKDSVDGQNVVIRKPLGPEIGTRESEEIGKMTQSRSTISKTKQKSSAQKEPPEAQFEPELSKKSVISSQLSLIASDDATQKRIREDIHTQASSQSVGFALGSKEDDNLGPISSKRSDSLKLQSITSVTSSRIMSGIDKKGSHTDIGHEAHETGVLSPTDKKGKLSTKSQSDINKKISSRQSFIDEIERNLVDTVKSKEIASKLRRAKSSSSSNISVASYNPRKSESGSQLSLAGATRGQKTKPLMESSQEKIDPKRNLKSIKSKESTPSRSDTMSNPEKIKAEKGH